MAHLFCASNTPFDSPRRRPRCGMSLSANTSVARTQISFSHVFLPGCPDGERSWSSTLGILYA